MPDRYFAQTPISVGNTVLAGPEAHHLIHVMRAKPGTRVILFDGSGAEFSARVHRVGRAEVELAVLDREEVNRELPINLTLGVALPKGDRQRWLVEKAVELGVARIVPLRSARSVAQPVEQALDRLRRTVIEASKQCGRNRLLEIARPRAWDDFVADTAQVLCRLLAQPQDHAHEAGAPRPSPGSLAQASERHPSDRELSEVLLAVGPEGGFTAEEVSLATTAGWKMVNLGRRILRVETAAILLVAIVTQPHPG
jgi:16S rRNA (uracil1498-N3)-methyltransferase